MHFDFFHPRDQIELAEARIYSRDMTTISDGNISILVPPCQVDKVAFSDEGAIERLK
jgi:hypothetical protein